MHTSDKRSLICFNSNIIYGPGSSFCLPLHVQLPSIQTLSKYSVFFSFFFVSISRSVFVRFLYIYRYILTFHTHSFYLCTHHPIPLMIKITITISISSFSLLLCILQFLLIGTTLYYIETKLNTT